MTIGIITPITPCFRLLKKTFRERIHTLLKSTEVHRTPRRFFSLWLLFRDGDWFADSFFKCAQLSNSCPFFYGGQFAPIGGPKDTSMKLVLSMIHAIVCSFVP